METDDCCPLCMEDMDVTDKNFRPCKCGYQICLFCYRHIKDDLNGLCPACRTPYDEANVTFVTPDPQEMAKLAKEKKAKELKDKKEQQAKEKRDAELKSRQEAQTRVAASAAAAAAAGSCSMAPGASASVAAVAPRPSATSSASANAASSVGAAAAVRQPSKVVPPIRPDMREVVPPMRVIQRTLVYVMGLSPRIAKEDILRRHEYFGQYGKILRIQVNSAHMHSASNGPPSCSCYITYSNREEAEQAILAVDNVVLDGRALKASFGTTKAPHAVAQGPGGGVQDAASLHETMPDREDAQRHSVGDPARGPHAPAAAPTAVPPPAAAPPPAVAAAAAVAPPATAAAAPTPAPSTAAIPTARPSHARPERPNAADGSLGGWEYPPPSPPLAPIVSSSVPPGGARLDLPAVSMPPVEPAAAVDLRAANAGMGCNSFMGVSMSSCAPGLGGADHIHGIASCPTGSEAEPWSMLGSFEDLLNGIVSDDDEEESTLPGSSRFARFFTSSPVDEPSRFAAPSVAPATSSSLGALGGIKLDVAEAEDDWQQGFRALLPNVNISFSAFGDGAMPPGALGGEALAQPAPAPAGLSLGSVGGLGGLAGFGAFGSSALSQQAKFASGCNGLHASAPHGSVGFSGGECGNIGAGGTSCSSGNINAPTGGVSESNSGACGANVLGSAGGGSTGSLGSSSFVLGGAAGLVGPSDQLGGSFSTGLGSAALNGAGSLSGGASSEVSLLSQLSSGGPLPGAQLPNSQLSSQLQSLLQGANSGNASSASGLIQSSGRAVGGALLPSSDSCPPNSLVGGASAPSSGLWSGSGAGGLMPGWLPSEGLLPLKGDDSGSVDGQSRDLAAGTKLAKKDVGGGSAANGGAERGAKAKKRGGTSNRGGKGDAKTVHK